MSLGISVMILANLGAGAWDAMYVGLSELTGLSVGTWILLVGIFLILLNSLILKKVPEFLSVITILIIGSLIDFWLLIIFSSFSPEDIVVRIFMFIIALLIIALGISCYLQSNFARNPMDTLMMAIQFRTGKSLAFSKTIMEVTVFIIALLLGGPIGLGTIIVTLSIGPLIQLFIGPITRIRNFLCTDRIETKSQQEGI
ncbi:MAG: membrane protein [Paenisporosarcina sp.]|nr:membrane protein [Paenisporosarcina sp.]